MTGRSVYTRYKGIGFMKNYFKVRAPRVLIGVVFATVAFIVTYRFSGNLKPCIVFATLFVLFGTINVDECTWGYRTKVIIYLVWFCVSAFVTCFLSELVLNEQLFSIGAFRILLSMLICLIVYLFLDTITLHPVFSVSISAIVLILGTAVNFYVYHFRGSEVQPADLLSITTAGDVAGEYKIVLTPTIIYAFVLIAGYIFLSFALPKIEAKYKGRQRITLLVTDIALIVLFLVLSRNIPFYHYLNIGSKTNGYILNFTLQLKETFVKKPDPYAVETIDDLSRQYVTSETKGPGDYPDIIVIMDESFADLSYLGNEINTNIEVTPYIDSLQDNTFSGFALSSVFGGNTANSEFEFLTGHSLAFFPLGSVAFQQYVDPGDYSMVSELNNLGYTTIAMHPNEGRCWAREVVYDKLGFDEKYFLEAFPNKDFRRDFISDQEMFETLLSQYEKHKESADNPVFIYGVTIQNHGSYEYSGDNYEQTITLEGYSQKYNDVEQYLSMLHETDKAVQTLLNCLAESDHDVVVVFYGDHFPSLNEHFFEEVHGGSFDSLDEQQKKYVVPFFIWTSYESDKGEVELTSLNYLSNFVYATAGIMLPEYNQALSDIMQTIPAINANGYYSMSEDRFLTQVESAGNEKDMLNLYSQLEYNAMFDKKNRNEVFFPFFN